MSKIIITESNESDFSKVVYSNSDCQVIHPTDVSGLSLNDYDAFVLLDTFEIDKNSSIVDSIRKTGKPAFIRTCPGLGSPENAEAVSTRFKRLITAGSIYGVPSNMLMDEQDNTHYPASPAANSTPLLIYGDHIMSHAEYDKEPETLPKEEYALWKEDNIIFCSFDISNFTKARFAPLKAWESLISGILSHLNCNPPANELDSGYTNGFLSSDNIELKDSFDKAVNWFDEADIIIDKGNGGVYEGYATEIKPDGTQKKAVEIRNDCCGETMYTFFLDSLLNDNKDSADISDNLSDYIFSEMFTDDPGGMLDGMMKWSLNSPDICYQDDVARAIIPQMLKCRFRGDESYLEKCTRALGFLHKTTGTDGLRVSRTENQKLNEKEIQRLASEPGAYPSAHYTAYYHAALLLNSIMTGSEEFLKTGVQGLETIMAVYPDTKRCQSETQEKARLILPLAYLYEATGSPEHRDMLYRVTSDLMEHRHKSGTYLEWDTGYKSRYSRTTGDECSILTKNGDPVSDLLYTVNWLPMGFISAYFATKDDMFLSLWEEICTFMADAQIISQNKTINGAWARGWDTGLKEVFALPNDVGWGPWCIESGWTVAEIASGMAMGLLKDNLIKFY